MAPIEWKWVTPEELVHEIEQTVNQYRENKYASQNGLKDLDFEVDHDLLLSLDLNTPFQTIAQAEKALSSGVITPKTFLEYDGIEHQVIAFDPRTVGYSGFMECCTHSLALTDLGLFEVGRYPAISLASPGKHWQWFLHRKLATAEEARTWQSEHQITPQQFLAAAYSALTGIE